MAESVIRTNPVYTGSSCQQSRDFHKAMGKIGGEALRRRSRITDAPMGAGDRPCEETNEYKGYYATTGPYAFEDASTLTVLAGISMFQVKAAIVRESLLTQLLDQGHFQRAGSFSTLNDSFLARSKWYFCVSKRKPWGTITSLIWVGDNPSDKPRERTTPSALRFSDGRRPGYRRTRHETTKNAYEAPRFCQCQIKS